MRPYPHPGHLGGRYEWRVDNTSPREVRSFQTLDFVRDPQDHDHGVGYPKVTPAPSYVYHPGAKLSLWMASDKVRARARMRMRVKMRVKMRVRV